MIETSETLDKKEDEQASPVRKLYRELSTLVSPHVRAKKMGPLFFVTVANAHKNGTLDVDRGDDGVIRGFAMWRRLVRTPEIVLDKLAVREGCENRGIGGGLLGGVIGIARCERRDVRTTTAVVGGAREFYERHGFVKTGDSSSGSVSLVTMRWSVGDR